jgi:hypothetical protein
MGSSESDKIFINFITKQESWFLKYLIEAQLSDLSPDSTKLKKEYIDKLDDLSSQDREDLANKILCQLRWYGSNSLAYIFRKTGLIDDLSYKDHLIFVCKTLNNNFDKKLNRKKGNNGIPVVGNVEDYENILADSLVDSSFKDKTKEELVRMFEDFGYSIFDAEMKSNIIEKSKYISLILLANILDLETLIKFYLDTLLQTIAAPMAGEQMGRSLVQFLKGGLVNKLPNDKRLLIVKIVAVIGAFAALNILMLSPARRRLIPCICLVALMRNYERLSSKVSE